MANFNQKLADEHIRHAIALQGYTQTEVNSMRRALNSAHRSAIDELNARLARLSPQHRRVGSQPQTARRVKQIIDSINNTSQATLVRERKRLVASLNELARIEANFATQSIINLLQTTANVEIVMRQVPPQLLRSIVTSQPMQGELLNDWFRGISRARQRNVTRAVNNGLVTGRSNQEIAREVRRTLNTTTRHAETITRTATNHVSNHAREKSYQENSDIVGEVQYIATLDARTTDICMSLDRQVFKVNEGPRPPMHHQCRSTTVPVVKPLDEIKISGVDFSSVPSGARASINGAVSADTSYSGWLRRQPASVQNEALGVGRAKLFRSGQIGVSDLVDGNFRTRTLDELRALAGS